MPTSELAPVTTTVGISIVEFTSSEVLGSVRPLLEDGTDDAALVRECSQC